MYEEGIAPATAVPSYGDLRWPKTDIVGTGTITHPTPTADTEMGLLHIATGANSGDGSVLAFPAGGDCPMYRRPGPGAMWTVKLRNSGAATNRYVWSGFVSAHSAVPVSGGGLDFIGVVCEALGSGVNWYGRTMAAGTVTDVDLGVSASTSFRTVGFEHTLDEVAGTTLGIQWFTLDTSIPARTFRTDCGSPITTNLPTVALTPVLLGISARSAGAKECEIDYWEVAGRMAR